MRRSSMIGDTLPGTCSRVKRSAWGKSSQKTSRQRSPPRIPVSQSWTRATLHRAIIGHGRARHLAARHHASAASRPTIGPRTRRAWVDAARPSCRAPGPCARSRRRPATRAPGRRGAASSRARPAGSARRAVPAASPPPAGSGWRRRAAPGHRTGAGAPDPPARRWGGRGSRPMRNVQHFADLPRLPGAQVVDLAGLALLQQQPVSADDVAHVGVVAPGLQGAHVDDRLAEPGLDLRDLPGEVRGDEHVAPPRPLVVEGAAAHDGQPVALEVLVAEEVLGDLADRVRRQGPERIVLGDGQFALVHRPVLLAGAHHEEAGPPGPLADAPPGGSPGTAC